MDERRTLYRGPAMRALVTGCAGFIGSQLTESLLADGVEVVGIDCFNDNYGRPQKLRNLERALSWQHFQFIPIDLARGDLADITADCDTVFHLAAEPGVRSSWAHRFEQYVRNNILATQHLLEAVRAAPETRFVFASSSSVYGQAETFPTHEDAVPSPLSPYGMTKLSAEQLCRIYHLNHGIQVVCLRLFSVYGPRQRPDMAFSQFCRAALDGTPVVVYGDGRQTRDFTFVSDVVDATRAAASTDKAVGRVFNVGGGSRTTLLDALHQIEEISGRKLELNHLPHQSGDVRDTAADISSARDTLGYEPRVTLADGLRAEWEWLAADLKRPASAVT